MASKLLLSWFITVTLVLAAMVVDANDDDVDASDEDLKQNGDLEQNEVDDKELPSEEEEEEEEEEVEELSVEDIDDVNGVFKKGDWVDSYEHIERIWQQQYTDEEAKLFDEAEKLVSESNKPLMDKFAENLDEETFKRYLEQPQKGEIPTDYVPKPVCQDMKKICTAGNLAGMFLRMVCRETCLQERRRVIEKSEL